MFLGETESFDDAVSLDDDLIAVTNGGELKRISKLDGTFTAVTQFPNAEIRRLIIVDGMAVVAVFPKRPDGVGILGKGELVVVPLTGGSNAVIATDFDSSTYVAGASDGIWVGSREMVVERRDLRFASAKPRFVREKVLDGGAAVRSIQNIVADKTGVIWGEHQMTRGPTHVFVLSASPSAKAPKELLRLETIGFDALALDARNLYFRADGQEPQTDAIHAVDRLSGADTVLARGLRQVWSLAAGSDRLCVADEGAKPQVSDGPDALTRGVVLSIPKSGGVAKPIATGLFKPRCVAADATSFYVTVGKRRGIARIPSGE